MPAAMESQPRPSMSSGTFSEYDDLRDFDGRFESKSTLGQPSGSGRTRTLSDGKHMPESRTTTKKPSRGILRRLKSTNNTPMGSPAMDPVMPRENGKRLKALRSMGSLRGRSTRLEVTTSKNASQNSSSLWLPPPRASEVGLGLEEVDWTDTIKKKSMSSPPTSFVSSQRAPPSLDLSTDSHPFPNPRANGRRSISIGATNSPSPPLSLMAASPQPTPANFQAALGNALIAASHAESAKGTHGDLLQILNHDRQPWGFSYAAYPHIVCVWYGDRDERIAENAVRWMQNTMGPDKCVVEVVKGADHSLMFRSGLVVDVLEKICDYWRDSE